MLHLESTRKIFKQVKDDTSSMLWLYDEESLLSARTTRTQQDMSTISTEFSFDSDLITSKVYRTAMRSHMIFAIGHTSGDSIYQPRPPLSAFRMTRSFSVRSDRLSISETLKTDFSDESIRDSASVSSRLTWLSQRRPLSIKVKGKPDTGDAQSVASKIGSMYTGDASLRRFWNRRNQAKTPSSPVLQGVAPAYAPKNATNVVVLGLARTGKSTLIKSLVYTFGGMDIRHRQSYNEDIQREATEAILVIQEDSGVRAGLGHHYCKHLHGSMGPDLGDVYALLWTEPVFRSKVIERQRSREKHIKPLPESAEQYVSILKFSISISDANLQFVSFLSSTQRLARPRYIPSASDVLWTYQPSQGISVTNIKARGRGYNFFDTQSSFDGLGYGHKFLRVLHRADVLVCTFDASCLGDTDHFHTSDKVMQSQMESLKGIVGDSRLLATKIIVLFTKVDRLVPDVMAQLLGTAQFIDFTGPKTVDTVLNHMARKIATLLGHTSKTITFWRASIAHSATEMADVALNALEQMDDSIEDTLDEEEEDEYKEKVFDYDDVMHAHGFI